MKKFPGRISSLVVFFEDFKYLEDVAPCIKTLFDFPRGQTVLQVLNQSFISLSAEVSRGAPSREGENRASREDRFNIARRGLFLFVMYHPIQRAGCGYGSDECSTYNTSCHSDYAGSEELDGIVVQGSV